MALNYHNNNHGQNLHNVAGTALLSTAAAEDIDDIDGINNNDAIIGLSLPLQEYSGATMGTGGRRNTHYISGDEDEEDEEEDGIDGNLLNQATAKRKKIKRRRKTSRRRKIKEKMMKQLRKARFSPTFHINKNTHQGNNNNSKKIHSSSDYNGGYINDSFEDHNDHHYHHPRNNNYEFILSGSEDEESSYDSWGNSRVSTSGRSSVSSLSWTGIQSLNSFRKNLMRSTRKKWKSASLDSSDVIFATVHQQSNPTSSRRHRHQHHRRTNSADGRPPTFINMTTKIAENITEHEYEDDDFENDAIWVKDHQMERPAKKRMRTCTDELDMPSTLSTVKESVSPQSTPKVVASPSFEYSPPSTTKKDIRDEEDDTMSILTNSIACSTHESSRMNTTMVSPITGTTAAFTATMKTAYQDVPKAVTTTTTIANHNNISSKNTQKIVSNTGAILGTVFVTTFSLVTFSFSLQSILWERSVLSLSSICSCTFSLIISLYVILQRLHLNTYDTRARSEKELLLKKLESLKKQNEILKKRRTSLAHIPEKKRVLEDQLMSLAAGTPNNIQSLYHKAKKYKQIQKELQKRIRGEILNTIFKSLFITSRPTNTSYSKLNPIGLEIMSGRLLSQFDFHHPRIVYFNAARFRSIIKMNQYSIKSLLQIVKEELFHENQQGKREKSECIFYSSFGL